MAAQHDLSIWRGADAPRLRFRMPVDGTGSGWRMAVVTPSGRLDFDTLNGSITAENVVVDGDTRTLVTIHMTLEQTRMIPPGRLSAYELEQVEPSGAQRVWLAGRIIAQGGINSDG